MKKSIFLIAALFMGVIFIQSCKKDNANEPETVAAEDMAVNQDLSEAIDLAADVAVEERGGGGACPVVTLEKPWGQWPNTLTIDYGSTGCTGPNGKHQLKGKIIVTQTAEWYTSQAVRTLDFENFFVDDVQVEGTKSWTNNGLDANGNWSFTKNAQNMVLTYADGTSTTWNLTHTTTLVEGGSTLFIWADNVWSTTGAMSGTNRDGVSYSASITEPLINQALCRWVSQGKIALNVGGNTATLDFGNGSCDRDATVILPNGDTVAIKLRP